MADFGQNQLEIAAEKFRRNRLQRQKPKSTALTSNHETDPLLDEEDDEILDYSQELEPFEEDDLESEDEVVNEEPLPKNKKTDPFLYTSKDVKITTTRIEIDNFTHAIRYLGGTKRIEHKPPLHECWLSIGFTGVALLTLITYLVLGKLKLGLLAVVYFSLISIAFIVVMLVCQHLKSKFSLELYNFNGDVIDRIGGLTKEKVTSIEAALKTALAEQDQDHLD